MTAISNKTAIVGTAYSRIGRHVDAPIGKLAIEATELALADAGLTLEDIDGISSYPNPSRINAGNVDGVDLVTMDYLTRTAPLPNLRWCSSITQGTVTSALVQAVNAVASEACNYALVFRAMHNPPGMFGVANVSRVSGNSEFSAPYGMGNVVQGAAMAYSRYLAKYGGTREQFATFVVNNRHNASRNPDAVFYGKPINVGDYLSCRMIAEPLSLLDCDMPVDGCGALIVTTAERARDLPTTPVYVTGSTALGISYAHSAAGTLEGYMDSAGRLAKAIWSNAGVGPSDMENLNLYDGFSYFVPLQLEAFGFCGEGEAFDFLQDGETKIGGRFPLNTSGGALGMGRLHGTPQLIEAVRQLQGRCGERQVDCSTSFVHTGSPQGGSGAVVLTNTA
jgi:acetyl-CoA acetyltransferase